MIKRFLTAVFIAASIPGAALAALDNKPGRTLDSVTLTPNSMLHSRISKAPKTFELSAKFIKTSSHPGTGDKTHLNLGSETPGLAGQIEFCNEHLDECGPQRDMGLIEATPENFNLLQGITDRYNNGIRFMTDWDHYKVADKWVYPEDGIGDCEDYVLLKRRDLIKAGLPASALSMAVVQSFSDPLTPEEKAQGIERAVLVGEKHAILVARTTQGDYVLDNATRAILPWRDTSYIWTMIQSPLHAYHWLQIMPDASGVLFDKSAFKTAEKEARQFTARLPLLTGPKSR